MVIVVHHLSFENYVNYAGSKTLYISPNAARLFENYVNYAGSKTIKWLTIATLMFENYVNYAGSKTEGVSFSTTTGLRTM